MKPTRRVLYKLCWDRRRGVYFGHATAGTLRSARRKAATLPADATVLAITKQRSRDVTNKVRGRPGSNPYVS